MKQIFLLLIFSLCSYSAFAQPLIPDFVSNVRYENHVDTLLKSYVKQFDMIIAVRTHYNWKYEAEYHMLVRNNGQWQKMTFKNKIGSLAKYDSPVPIRNKYKGECDTLFNKLLENNLFAIDDDQIYPPCAEKDTIINGKHRMLKIGVENAAGYSIWMVTPAKSRQLYYYAPEYYNQYCSPYWDRRNAIDIITLFTKDW